MWSIIYIHIGVYYVYVHVYSVVCFFVINVLYSGPQSRYYLHFRIPVDATTWRSRGRYKWNTLVPVTLGALTSLFCGPI